MIPMSLAQQIHELVMDMPQELVVTLVSALESGENGRWSQLQTNVAQAVNQPSIRQKVVDFLNYWQESHPEISIEAVSLAMLTAVHAAHYHSHAQQLEIVWTGPDSQIIPLRRNDQALLQLIHSAQETLHIVSFAVYKADNIHQAIIDAANRGVAISIYLETPDESDGKMSFDTVKALGEEVVKRVKLFVWPREKRPLAENGKVGSLHAKVALADGRLLLISSANLTGYAMTLNMEMGVMIRGGDAPAQVERHLLRLIEQGDFEQI